MSRIIETRKIFGYYLILDLYDCDPKMSQDMVKCYQYLDRMPGIIKTHKQSPPFIFYKEKIGICGWVPIVESGISIYSAFSINFVSVDVYSCKKFNPRKITKFTFNYFKPKKIKKQYFLRGKKYIHPSKLLKLRKLL